MYNAINTSEIKQVIGKVNLNLESLIERMNAGEILELHLEATHGNGQLAPITFYPDDYEVQRMLSKQILKVQMTSGDSLKLNGVDGMHIS